jgi:hypothetical protein
MHEYSVELLFELVYVKSVLTARLHIRVKQEI